MSTSSSCQPFAKMPIKNTLGVKVYISGQITGVTGYKERFNAIESKLKDLGFHVTNPCRNGVLKDAPYSDHMLVDIRLLKRCNYIYYISGKPSNGMLIEKEVAESHGIPELILI